LLLPKDERFNWPLYGFGALGPVDRFRPTPEVEACRLLEGTGKNVGVCGRDADADDKPFPPDSLGLGNRNPVLTAKGLDTVLSIPVLTEGEGARRDEAGRNIGVDVGLDNLRLSLNLLTSLSFCGEGESSIIRTQPDELLASFLAFLSNSLSLLRRDSSLFLWDSQLVLAVDAFEVTDDDELMGVEVPVFDSTL